MNPTRSLFIAIGLSIGSSVFGAEAVNRPDPTTKPVQLRDWTPADSVRMRFFTTPANVIGVSSADVATVATPSPDGSRFFVAARRGDLVRNVNITELFVFSVRDVVASLESANQAHPPKPISSVQMAHGLAPAIFRPRWNGNDAIVFIGRRDAESTSQVYRLTISDSKLEQLTQAKLGDASGLIGLGDFAIQGHGVIARGSDQTLEKPDDLALYTLTEKRASDLLWHREDLKQALKSYVSYANGPTWAVPLSFTEPSLARDGTLAVQTQLVDSAPPRWKSYKGNKTLRPGETESERVGDRSMLKGFHQFVLIDLRRQRAEPIFDAPTGEAIISEVRLSPQAFWSEDALNVVLVNTALPLGSHPDATTTAFLVSYDVEAGTYVVLEPVLQGSMHVKDVAWMNPGRELLVRHERDRQLTEGTLYTYSNGSWKASPVAATVQVKVPAKVELADGLKIEARQSANAPAIVIATRNGREVPLFAPDPVLEGLEIATTQAFSWRDSDGTMVTGTLTLPRRMPSPGAKAPLVIQFGILQPDDIRLRNFLPEGQLATTAYAAQALAAEDMFVLCVAAPTGHVTTGKIDEQKEMTLVEDWVVTATDTLARAYPIDAKKVGLVGFSRTGYEVRYMLTNLQRRLLPAAAVIADSYTGSYLLSLAEVAMYGEPENVLDNYYGVYGGPFHQAKATWLEREVSFNVDRVRTPILFADNRDTGFSLTSDTVGAFKANHKPFDYIFLPNGGGHQLTKPRSRTESMQATVDWMAFWLQDKTPGDPERAARWAILRKQQDEVLKTPPPKIGHWQFIPDPVQPEWHPPGEAKKEDPKPEPTGAGKN